MTTQTYPPFSVIIVDADGNPVNTQAPALGQQLAAESMPVVLTAAQLDALVRPLFDSNGTRLPENFGSLPYTVAYNSNSTVYTRIAGGNTYIQTSTIDSNGMEISNSGWVKQ